MDESTIDSLKKESEKIDAKAIDTIRYPKEIEKEIRDFCKETGVKMSVVLRRCLVLGWKEMNK